MWNRMFAVCVLVLALAGTARAEEVPVTFLHFNDIYDFMPGDDSGGMAGVAGLVARERAAHPGAVLTFGGDLLSPSVASSVTQGAHMVELLNRMAPEAAVLGNHEFDFGAQVLRRRMMESSFPWLAANVSEVDGKAFGVSRPWVLVERNGVRIGLFGILTSETGVLAAGAGDVRFLPEEETARAMVAELRNQGAELVVALTHQDLERDLALARKVKGIDLILGGHDHLAVTVEEGDTVVAKAGHDGVYLAAVDMVLERPGHGGKASSARVAGWRMLASRNAPQDPDVAVLVNRYAADLDGSLARPLAILDKPLDSRQTVVRGAESSLGDLVADAAREAMGADVALVNGGGLRGNRLYSAGSALTRGDLLREMPFGNVVMMVEVDGRQLLAALEHGVSKVSAGAGRFPQVSGIRFTYDPDAPAGQRVGAASVGGKPLDLAARYRLAVSDYLAQGGDGYAMLAGAKVLRNREAAPLLVTVVMERVERLGRLGVVPDGRIRVERRAGAAGN